MIELGGQTVGNYRIEAPLGGGAMAQVYRGVHIHLGRPVAIKVMLPHLAADPAFRDRFLQEAKAIAALNHPNIVGVYDFGEQDDRLYLVMELLDGGSLAALLRRHSDTQQGWSLGMGLDLLRQAADGLDHAHQKGMVHRDIKPDNLLLADGEDGAVAEQPALLKVGDFGLARLAEGGLRTATGLTMGTPAYMSPEQCQGLELDGRSDIYSLGVVLYQVATGALPFMAKSLTDAAYKHVHVAPPAPRQVRPDLPPELEQLILRCLAKDPAGRYQTAGELAQALTQATPRTLGTTVAALPSADPSATVLRPNPRGEAPPEPPSIVAPLSAPRVRVLDAASHPLHDIRLTGAGLTVGRSDDNDLALDAPAVSRQHARLDWDGERAGVTDLGSANGTLLGDRRLLPHVAQSWDPRDWLRIGEFWLRLDLPGEAALRRANQQTVQVPSPVAVDAVVDSGRIRLLLEPEALTLTPGQPALLRVTLANLGSTVDHFSLSVEGAPAAWVTLPGALQLNPHGQSAVTLTITVPRAPGNFAGQYPVHLRARSRENPAEAGTASGLWTVLPFEAPALALSPRRAGARRRATYLVNLENGGNATTRYVLTATDDEQYLDLSFSQEAIAVEPFSTASLPLLAQAPRRWFGRPQQRPFTVQARPAAGGPVQTAGGVFVHRTLLPGWVPLLILALVAALALLFKTLSTPAAVVATPIVGATTQAAVSTAAAVAGGGATSGITCPPDGSTFVYTDQELTTEAQSFLASSKVPLPVSNPHIAVTAQNLDVTANRSGPGGGPTEVHIVPHADGQGGLRFDVDSALLGALSGQITQQINADLKQHGVTVNNVLLQPGKLTVCGTLK